MSQIYSKYCPCCEKKLMINYRRIDSLLEVVPEGLDRPNHVIVDIKRCKKCGLYETLPVSDQRSISQMYNDDSLSFSNSLSKVKHKGLTTTLNELKLISKNPPAKILEIGCGAGNFLINANLAGYDVTGIDLDKKAVEHVKNNLGLKAYNCSLDQLDSEKKFDVIVLLGVFEHIPDPNSFLNTLKSYLNKNGELIIGVPNVKSINQWVSKLSKHSWDMFLEPGHIYHYEINTLTKILNNSSFQLKKWKTATVKIRGKVPFFKNRIYQVEQKIKSYTEKYYLAEIFYTLLLKSLDIFKVGDTLVANFTVNHTNKIYDKR